MISLTPTQRRELRARAHPLHPVVAIGHGGLTPAVLHELDVALNAHELVKVRVHADDRDEREAHLATICEALSAAPVQHLGKMLIVWRPAPKKEPLARAKKPTKRGHDPRVKPGDRRRSRDEPGKGGRARKHLRGSARHEKPPLATIDAPRPPRRKPGAEGVEPIVPATTASRGKRYVGGQAVVPGTQRPPSRRRRTDTTSSDVAADRPPKASGKRPPAGDKRPRAGDKRPPAGDKRPRAGEKRPPASGKRPPAGGKRPPAGDKRAPAGVQRRRRPTGRS